MHWLLRSYFKLKSNKFNPSGRGEVIQSLPQYYIRNLTEFMKKKYLLIFLILAISSCYSRGKFGSDTQIFNETTKNYYKFLMWKYYDRAKNFIDLEDRQPYEEFVLKAEKDLNITGYEMRELIYNEEGNECDIKLVITYYKYPSVSEKTEVLYEKWVKRGSNWFVKPDFKLPFYSDFN
jgi:hypothetical protein